MYVCMQYIQLFASPSVCLYGWMYNSEEEEQNKNNKKTLSN